MAGEQVQISKEEYERLLNIQQSQAELIRLVSQLQKQFDESIEQNASIKRDAATLVSKNEELQKQVQEVQEQVSTFSLHFGRMYASQSIEETLTAMAELGSMEMQANECAVYSVDAYNNNSMFTINTDGERNYISPEADSLLAKAIEQHQSFIINDTQTAPQNISVGDGTIAQNSKNVLVVPLEDRNGDVIGLAVAKDKEDGFTQKDIDAFNLKDGKIGTAFRMGLENKALQQKSTTDQLTHLQNREGMNQFIKQQALPHIQHNEPCSVMIMDIDKFKKFNDTYGHEVGDDCLKLVANTLKENLRASDDSSVFRWGGEEMVVIVPVDEKKAAEIADRLREAVHNTPLTLESGEQVPVSVSVGVAQFKTDMSYGINKGNVLDEFEKTFKRADDSLYFAKEHGRNQICESQTIEDVFKNCNLDNTIVADGEKDSFWISQDQNMLVAYSGIIGSSSAGSEDVIKTLAARVANSTHEEVSFDNFENVGVNFLLSNGGGITAELEEAGKEGSKRISVPLTEQEQAEVLAAIIDYTNEHSIVQPEFIVKMGYDMLLDNSVTPEVSLPSPEVNPDKPESSLDTPTIPDNDIPEAPNEIKNAPIAPEAPIADVPDAETARDEAPAKDFTPTEAFENMLAVMDYVVDKNDNGEYMIFDQQTETYLENYDNPDGTYSGNTFKTAQEIIDRLDGAIEEHIIENVRDAIEEVLPSIDPAKYEAAGIQPPSETPSGSAMEIAAFLEADPILKDAMITAGYDADVQYVNLLAFDTDNINLEQLFSEKYKDDVEIDKYDSDVVQFDAAEGIIDARVDISDTILTDLLRTTDFDFGEQESAVRSGADVDLEAAGIEYADLYVTYHEDSSPETYVLSVQMTDDNKLYFHSDANTLEGEHALLVPNEMKEAVNAAITEHFDGKSMEEVFKDFREEEKTDISE
jgi:diguanylate cyclase (GGDEF)-like protein